MEGIKFQDYQLDARNERLTVYFTHTVDDELPYYDVDVCDYSEDACEFKSWVLRTVKDDDCYDLGGVLPSGLTFMDFWDTLTESQKSEWVNEYVQVLVSEGAIVAKTVSVVSDSILGRAA